MKRAFTFLVVALIAVTQPITVGLLRLMRLNAFGV